MASSLLNLAYNLSEGTHRIKCNSDTIIKNKETCVIKCKYCYTNTQTLKMI